MVKITTSTGRVVEGEVYAIDPVTKSVVLAQEEGKYSIIIQQHIVAIEGDLRTPRTPDLAKIGISVASLDRKEDALMRQTDKNLLSINEHVSPEAQALFDRIHFMYPCRWDKDAIVVIDEYVIKAPYATVQSLHNKEGPGLDRLVKLLEGERRKLNL